MLNFSDRPHGLKMALAIEDPLKLGRDTVEADRGNGTFPISVIAV